MRRGGSSLAAGLQTPPWIGATIIGIALMGGQFVRWPLFGKAMAVEVPLGITC